MQTDARSSRTTSTPARIGSSSIRPRRSSGGSSSRSTSTTVTTTCRCSSLRTRARATAAAERRRADAALLGPHPVRRGARRSRGPARGSRGGRAVAAGGRPGRGARDAPAHRRGLRRAARRRAGGTRGAGAAERGVRAPLRLRVRGLRRWPHARRAAAGAARAAGSHACGGARDGSAGTVRDCEGQVDAGYLRDLADLAFRMLHVVAGIAWIGASFYFIRLDLGLAPPREPREGIAGEYWGVHGGGFYHSQKYKVAPPVLPDHLHWFKWEAYTTWLSGFSLLVVLYWLDADARLVDPTVADLEPWQAAGLSAAGLVLAWLVYDLACRLLIEDRLVAIAVAALVTLSAFAASQLFAARASYLQVGAMLGTIMAANVFFVIIPAHRELVRAKEEGREPNPLPGQRAKQRSVHNNYLTLPVVFTMLAGHFPIAFGSDHAWLVLLAIFAIVAGIRHFFNRWHTGKHDWWILAAAGVAAAALAVALAPEESAPAAVPSDAVAAEIVSERCQSCHSGAGAPLGVRLETLEQMTQHAAAIERMVSSRAMPPGNATGLTDAERAQLVAWAAAHG